MLTGDDTDNETGSPPHMRGKVFFASVCVDFSGITPAHAGKSVRVHGLPAGREDHPRTCGEKRSRASSGKVNLGSPPHMRGKVSDLREGAASHRDHPRTCGEKPALWLLVALLWGSPPHMRGKAICCGAVRLPVGITPAHAGKRSCTRAVSPGSTDHPRTCGEKLDQTTNTNEATGSPPHMRGKD